MSVLSIRETEPLLRLASYRYLSRSQIEEFLLEGSAVTPPSREVITGRVLRRLTTRGLIAAVPRPSSEPGGGSARLAYFLTPAGYKLAGSLNPGVPEWRPALRSTFLMSHGLATADIALAFRRAARASRGHEIIEWECDWQAAERLGSTLVIPDAHLVYATAAYEIEAFIEVDLGTERTRVFARKISQYLDLYRSGTWQAHLPTWPLVLTVASTETRAAALRRATESVLLSQHDGENVAKATEFRFSSLGDVLGSTGPLGGIWQVAGRSGVERLLPVTIDSKTDEVKCPSPADAGVALSAITERIPKDPLQRTP